MISSSLGRREINKARTRAALIAAAYDLIDSEGFDDLTAERVADAAGLSRRTFFNYFESVEAAIALGADEVMETVGRALAARPAEESPILSAITVIEDLFTLEFLAEATRAWRAVQGLPAARRHALAAQADQVTELAQEWAVRRLDPAGADPLRARVLTAALLSAFEEARLHWLAGFDGEVDERARRVFLDTVRAALEIIRPALEH